MLDVQAVPDYSRTTLRDLAARLQDSRTLEQLVYREAELGEIWSLIDGDLETCRRRALLDPDGGALDALQRAIIEVLCLLTMREDGVRAANRLRAALLESASAIPGA